MLNELSLTALASFSYRFAAPPARLAAASIAAGNTAGRLWTGDPGTASCSVVLWDQGNNLLYLSIAPDDDQALHELLNHELRTAALNAGLERLGVRALDDATEHKLPELLAHLRYSERRSMFWRWPAGRQVDTHSVSLAGVRWAPIDSWLLARDDMLGLDEVRQEISWMWPSVERYQRSGFGVAALLDNQIICWCTVEYVSREHCGIGIATAEAYRGHGIATATAAELLRHALDHGLSPCWECGADNTASARLAAKLGFELLLEHTTWLIELRIEN